jgi:hypothetical protein
MMLGAAGTTSRQRRALPAALDRGGRGTSGYALSGFIAGLDVARARRDEAAIERWSEVIEEIVGQFEEAIPPVDCRRSGPDSEALATGIAADSQFYIERLHHVERAFATCADRRQAVAAAAVEEVAAAAARREARPLLGQALRVRGLQDGTEPDLQSALAIFEEIQSVPYVGRLQVELGTLTGDRPLTERGIAVLEDLGDVDQLERIAR